MTERKEGFVTYNDLLEVAQKALAIATALHETRYKDAFSEAESLIYHVEKMITAGSPLTDEEEKQLLGN